MLKVLINLFQSMEENNYRYVLWKSLEFYEEQLSGEGDVDVVFDKDKKNEVHNFIINRGFCEDKGTDARVGEDVKVYRVIDNDTSTHTSIHAYYGCRTGSKKYKEFRLSFENEMFDFCIKQNDINRLCEGHFIATRILIITLRKTYDDKYVCELAKTFDSLPNKQKDIAIKCLARYFSVDIIKLIEELSKGKMNILNLEYENVSKKIDSKHPINQAITDVKKTPNSKTLINRYIPDLLRVKRNKLGVSMEVLLAGHDGVGKSSVSTEIVNDLSTICSTKRIYLGRNSWSYPNRIIDRVRSKQYFVIFNWLWVYTSTFEILLRHLKGKVLKICGWIVIYDRSLIDLKIKYEKYRLPYSWFPLLTCRIFKNYNYDIHYLLTCDPEKVIQRKGKHTLSEIENISKKYNEFCRMDTKTIDTSNISIRDITSLIIDDVFMLANSKS